METRNFKDSTKAAEAYLAEHGIDVPHTRLLEAFSRAFGERNWSTLSAQLQKLQAPTAAPAEDTVPSWDESQGPMSEDQYVACGGECCPYCGSKDLDVGKIDMDGPHGTEETTCEGCTATWKSAYTLTGYFGGEPGASQPASTLPSIILVRPGTAANVFEGMLFETAAARPVLVETLGTDEYISDEALLGMIHDQESCIEALKQHGIAHRSRAVRSSQWEVRTVLSMEAHEMNLTVQAGRKEVIEDLLEDVRERARRHAFSVHGWARALECVANTNEVLNMDATPAEQFAAASHLA